MRTTTQPTTGIISVVIKTPHGQRSISTGCTNPANLAHSLSPSALQAFRELKAGKKCVPEQSVCDELGRFGLAYKPDRRIRSRRIVLTTAGHHTRLPDQTCQPPCSCQEK